MNPITATGNEVWQDYLKKLELDKKFFEELWPAPKPDKKGWKKEKPDPKLVVVDLTTEQVQALLENPKGVQVVVNEDYVVLIREV